MRRRIILSTFFFLFFFWALPFLVIANEGFPEFKYTGLLDLRIANTDDTRSWLDKGLGKTRYGASNDGDSRTLAQLAEVAMVMSVRFNWDFSGHFVLKYDPEQKNTVDLLEGFIAYRPITTSDYRFKSRVGVFFPPISLENKGIAWTSPYSITPSAINSWIGEEVRTIGAEFSVLRPGEDDYLSFTAAFFKGNDPTGSLLSYRGWAMHDRKVASTDRVPLAPIESLQPGNAFAAQEPWVTPFAELDGHWGSYAAAAWKHLDMAEFRLLYYDNRANPSIFLDGQYAWQTRFTSLGAKFELEGAIDILFQYMRGNTRMGLGGKPIDNDFSAYYALVSKRLEKHRVTLRYDNFEVEDLDKNIMVANDFNAEEGDAWTFAYIYRMKRKHLIIFEALRIASDRPARAQIALPSDVNETLMQASYRIFL